MTRTITATCWAPLLVVVAMPFQPATAQPVCLVSLGTTLYRVNGDGAGLVETYANQPGTIIGMTLVPAGATVTGCAPGDVLAVEQGDGGRFWRVDAAACGTPRLSEVGRLPSTVKVSSIAFAHGQLFGIDGVANFYAFNPTNFQPVGPAVDLSSASVVGGMAFDGTSTWYFTNGGNSNLIRDVDPPTAAAWTAIGNVGINFDSSGLEMYAGQLWGALRVQATNGHLLVGTFDVLTGIFSQVWDVASGPSDNVGFVAFARPVISRGDVNCDGHFDTNDVAPFVLALVNPAAFVAAYPGCPILNADLNKDCLENGLDIQPFVDQLLGP
ncbi:MAG: hypothetical protein U1A27_11180 [Phycisphaerae bacterium]